MHRLPDVKIQDFEPQIIISLGLCVLAMGCVLVAASLDTSPVRHDRRTPVKKILRGDIAAQLQTLTALMLEVLRCVNEGKHAYGRGIATACRMSYPQTYNTLNSLKARGFIGSHEVWGDTGVRKMYHLTPEGVELLAQAEEMPDLTERRPRVTTPVDPETYVHRMRIGSVLRWLQKHRVVDSYEELVHVMECDACNRNIGVYGFTGDVRCEEAAQKVNDKEWT